MSGLLWAFKETEEKREKSPLRTLARGLVEAILSLSSVTSKELQYDLTLWVDDWFCHSQSKSILL